MAVTVLPVWDYLHFTASLYREIAPPLLVCLISCLSPIHAGGQRLFAFSTPDIPVQVDFATLCKRFLVYVCLFAVQKLSLRPPLICVPLFGAAALVFRLHVKEH